MTLKQTYPCYLNKGVLRILWDDEAMLLLFHALQVDELHVDVEPGVDGERRQVPLELLQDHQLLLQDLRHGARPVRHVGEFSQPWRVDLLQEQQMYEWNFISLLPKIN